MRIGGFVQLKCLVKIHGSRSILVHSQNIEIRHRGNNALFLSAIPCTLDPYIPFVIEIRILRSFYRQTLLRGSLFENWSFLSFYISIYRINTRIYLYFSFWNFSHSFRKFENFSFVDKQSLRLRSRWWREK